MSDLLARIRSWFGQADLPLHRAVDRKLKRQEQDLAKIERVAAEQKQLAATLRSTVKAMRSDAKH